MKEVVSWVLNNLGNLLWLVVMIVVVVMLLLSFLAIALKGSGRNQGMPDGIDIPRGAFYDMTRKKD